MNKSLANLGIITYGKDYKKNPPGDEYPIIGTSGVMGYTSRFLNDGQAIILGRKGTINKPQFIDKRFWNVDTAYCLKASNETDPRWLFYSLCNKNLSILNEATGVPSVSTTALYSLKFSNVPPLPVQRKIAHILSTVDRQIEKTEQLIRKYEMVKEGMMQDLFTRGIDVKTGKLRPLYDEAPGLYKQSELGWIPKEWKVMRLSELCTMKSGEGITSLSIDNFGDYPVYGGNGLRGYTASYTHEGSYVLIGRQGALCGNIVNVKGKFYASEHAVVVTTNDIANVDWIGIKLDLMNLNQYSEASAQPGLSVSKIVRLKIPIPTIPEQEMIYQSIQGILRKLDTEESVMTYFQMIKKGLMHDLLSGSLHLKS